MSAPAGPPGSCRTGGRRAPLTRASVRRRLLFLLPCAPRLDASHGGGRAAAHLLTALAARHDVGLLVLRDHDEPRVDEALGRRAALVEEWSRPGRVARTLRLLPSLLGGRPLRIADWTVPGFARRVTAVARSWRPDIVQIEFAEMGQYLPALAACDAPRVLTVHEPGTLAARERMGRRRGPIRTIARLDLRAWERFERTIVAGVDAVVAFTDRDRRALLPVAGATPVVRIPLAVPVPEHALDPAGTPPSTVLFVGSFIHFPNVDAAAWLAREIFPEVRARCPEATLEIVGDRPPRALRRLGGAGIRVVGRVPDVTPHLDRAAVVVAPLRLGGGMRVKVLEALAAGKPVVATPLAAAGLDVADGAEIILAESAEAFGAAVGRLLIDPGRRVALAARAREWAIANISPERCAEGYEALYDELTVEPAAARAR